MSLASPDPAYAVIAAELFVYIGACIVTHDPATLSYFLTTNFPPRFGEVVLIHKLPSGLGLESVEKYCGICVWVAYVRIGLR